MSAEARGNFKTMWNSPIELNPTRIKIEAPIRVAVAKELIGSLADSTGSSILAHAGGILKTPSGKQIELPATGSLSAYEAELWQRYKLADVEEMINKNTSLQEQAAQAVALGRDIVSIARNAMAAANAAAQLGITAPIRSLNEILRSFGQNRSGDILFNRVISDTKEIFGFRQNLADITCFGKGTLVHTRDGLVPIEEIKVGDWVLSQPEEKGEQAYKRVVRTMEFDDQPVYFLSYYKIAKTIVDGKEVLGVVDQDANNTLIVTGNHPFWVAGHKEDYFHPEEVLPLGWIRADLLRQGFHLELANGDFVVVSCVDRLWRTKTDGLAWRDLNQSSIGMHVDLRESMSFYRRRRGQPVVDTDFGWSDTDFSLRYETEEQADIWSYKTTVYNFEVEDFHTYYVGEFGVWVHNTNCGPRFYSDSIAPAKQAGVLRSPDTSVYYSEKDLKDAISNSKPEIHARPCTGV